MRLNELRDTSFEIAKSKGWHDPEFDTATFADRMALVISELAEALEEYRAGRFPREIEFRKAGTTSVVWYRPGEEKPSVSHETTLRTGLLLSESGYKPEGVVIELADAAIRIGDAAGKHEIDLEQGYSESLRELGRLSLATNDHEVDCASDCGTCRAGSTPHVLSFGAWFCAASDRLCDAAYLHEHGEAFAKAISLREALRTICRMANWLGITGEEFVRAVEIKHSYNRTRSFRHGGKKL